MDGDAVYRPGGIPEGKRATKFASTRLLKEWSALQPWQEPPIYELRLGPTPLSPNVDVLTPQVEAMLRVFNRYADLVGITDQEIQVVEAKIFPDPGAISQVKHYETLIHSTPLLRQYPGRIVQPVILVALSDPIMAQAAAAQGIRWIVYTPAWVSGYVQTRYTARKVREALSE